MTTDFTGINKYVFIIITTLLIICFFSCKNNKQRDDAVKTIKEWTGKEIKFPEGIPCTSMGNDTTCMDLQNSNYKIMLYVDSLGCTSCRLKLSEWKKIMKEADSIFSKKTEFAFYFQPKKKGEKELQLILKNNNFGHPIFIDKENEINKLNKFPSRFEYQCFLLDKDNKVVIVGNPSLNPGIWTLYKKIITEREI